MDSYIDGENMKTALQICKIARAEYGHDEIEVDIPKDAEAAEKMLSRGDDGVWVKAWVWLSIRDIL